jgi:Amt family ammonium transporter
VVDARQALGVHGIGGLTGTLLTGVFAVAAVGETAGLLEGNGKQVLIQLYGIVVTIIWSGVLSFVLLKVIEFFVPLRVRTEDEQTGLDVALHGEAIQ